MKFLIVRFSSIGDVVLTTPIIRCLKKQVPNAELHFITKKSFQSVLELNPNIDKLHTVDKDFSEILEQLKAEKYDQIIDLHHNLRTLRLKKKLGVPCYSFNKLNIRKFFYTKFKINRMPKVHVVDRYFETVKHLGVVNDFQPCDLFLSEQDEINFLDFGLRPNQFISVSLGAQYETKQIPLEILSKSLSHLSCPIVLLGGTMDEERAKQLQALLPDKNIIHFAGKLSLRQSAFVLKYSMLLITGDTGLMHIASCFQTPIVSIWGNTTPELGMYAYAMHEDNLSIHQVENLSCRPCSKIGYHSCPKKHFNCMNQQNLQSIQDAIAEKLLS